MQYTYNPEGVCSMKMIFDIEQNVIKSLKIIGGCPGDDVIEMLKGIECGVKGTSCPDQVARALENYKKENL